MLGVDMMMKALGLEPQVFVKTIENLGAVASELKTQLDRIERNQIVLNHKFDKMAQLVNTETFSARCLEVGHGTGHTAGDAE